MSFIDSIRYRLRVLGGPRAHEREVAEEIEFHVELEAMQRAHAARGALSQRAALDAARKRFGNSTYYREETRRVSGLTFLDTLVQDVKFGIRTLRRAPTFTAVTVATLAIGIGANTAIFSAVYAMILRPLPYRDPSSLMSLSLRAPGPPARPEMRDLSWSYPKFEAFRDSQTAFSSMTVWTESQFTVSRGGDGVRAAGEYVDVSYLSTLGVHPQLGRDFRSDEGRAIGAPHVAMLSDELWQQLYNADPAVVGRTIDVDGNPFTIIGVAPPRFRGLTGAAYLWMPVGSAPSDWGSDNPNNHRYFAVGRLAPGVTRERAKSIADQTGARVDARFPDPINPARHWTAGARALDDVRVDADVRETLLILLGAVGIVLLIACTNVANLFLVRATSRRREIAVRLAIGAGRRRLVRQLVVESLLLSTMGGVASVLVALAGVKGLSLLQPAYALGGQSSAGLGPVDLGEIRLNAPTFLFAAALAIVTGLVFGLVPALKATRPSLTETLKDDGGFRVRGRRGVTGRSVLTVVEIAMAVVLLAASGLLMHSLERLLSVRPGFDADHVLTMRINRAPAWAKDSLSEFYDRSLEALASMPGVVDVAIGDNAPVGGTSAITVLLRDREPPARGSEPRFGLHYITPAWPSVMHVPLLRGRLFTTGDRPNTRRVVLVNETAARAFWPGQDPIGRPVTVMEGAFGSDTEYVAGVIGDVQYGGLASEMHPDVYISYYQLPFSWRMMMFIRTRGDPAALAARARETLRRTAPGFPVYDVRTMEERIGIDTAAPRFSAELLTLFAVLALVLAMVGTYGVISYSVAQRTREFGVRVALGATRGDVVRLVIEQGIVLAAMGMAGGLIAAVVVTRMLKSMLYGIEPTDPATMVGIIVVLAVAVLLASWIPARRAAGVPAVQALRGE